MKFRQRFPPDEPPEAPLTSWALYDGFWPIAACHEVQLSANGCLEPFARMPRPLPDTPNAESDNNQR